MILQLTLLSLGSTFAAKKVYSKVFVKCKLSPVEQYPKIQHPFQTHLKPPKQAQFVPGNS